MAEAAPMLDACGHAGKTQDYCRKRIDYQCDTDDMSRRRFAEDSGDPLRSRQKGKSPPGKDADRNKQRKCQKSSDGKAVQAVHLLYQFLSKYSCAILDFIHNSRQVLSSHVSHAIPDTLHKDTYV